MRITATEVQKDLEINLVLNETRKSIKSSNEKDWAKIKQNIELKEF